ncbi:sensor histidine kinase KdpD [Kamptonema cortianum]|uniref:Sensor histidine kinase KdpD n=1 Tax=Geitlerinema calcuttense NRMC-F 0142 TaxID=2922238 RepID=A0ABT7LVW2_9CYAN|nr:universal stress protein [Geitlerinema calcuttense]MDK3158128.1 sensor histidine kinase KdpD [Kamptonema cortianum]MDL5056163.1 sensor histidine kinase KdpD [Geitlerinema calcuttense NRMC-F 0142]
MINNATYLTSRRGKHKIFVGMAPGVGKTFKMLEEAHLLKQEGIDVAIGLLETHGRKETAEKAEGLEIIPRKEMIRGEKSLTEMDVNAILNRQPQLVLVDELAHTNIPGDGREKRYQDVEAILDAGIDVYSTVNIQHLESLNDIVARITGVVVRERIPDRVLDEADEVVVVDVTPETLEERLREGKIYAPHKIQQALSNFFQRRHLVALRELALREVADNLEEVAIATTPAGEVCNIQERVLVCVSTYPNSLQLLRRGARLASYMNAPLFVVFVANPDRFLTRAETLHIENCERLTGEFEGKFIRLDRVDVVKAIAQVATQYRATQVVVGTTRRSRWQVLLQGSFIEKLMRSLANIDLHVIATDRDKG